MIVERLSSDIDIKRHLNRIGVDGGGVNILAAKSKLHIIQIRDFHVGAANILKQDALSVGADLAVPRGTILAETPRVDALLIATTRALGKLAKKEKLQPFGLKGLSGKLEEILALKAVKKVDIMGVINANDDSFFSKSRFSGEDALTIIEQMISDGATIIDIGGVSSAPNAKSVPAQEELRRIKPICDLIKEQKLFERVTFSIDSYEPVVIEYALKSGFHIVNDIRGLESDSVCEICAEYKAEVIIMHMQGRPQTMQNNPNYENLLDEVYSFLESRVKKAESYGIENITLDVGIGFGKRLEDNLQLIKHLGHFQTLGKPLLVGASRKSMIDQVSPATVEDRLGGTLAIHLEAMRNGASILRVHDVKEHAQAVKLQEALNSV